ncbi:YciI family protein [Amycolatopsis mongoliensis]|uniref:YciI family protein n=1 Tax=Amycolatopsis mongoliensis TaxID=715475 RepID=A0A9Y2JP21_9PSEU|nr:YciI family protein [Amycolatopsis sp. 4-36]WIY00996.1 YciI family protein [Amycolatopsis sp. 4-36]
MESRKAKPDERHTGAQKVVFLCFTEPVSMSPEDMRPHLDEHKAWLTELERAGELLFAGPMLDDDYRYSGAGLLVLRADSVTEAKDIADRDPFHARGIRKYRIVPWQINEGSVEVRLTLSDGRFTLA